MANHFLAVDASDEDRHRLATVLGDVGASDVIPGRRVPIENWHITVRFLGDMTDLAVETLMGRLDETLAVEPGRVWLDGIGAFPKPSKATVVYCSVDDPQSLLDRVAGLCEEASLDAGLEPEDRPFNPHLTLSRVRPQVDLRYALAGIDPFRIPLDVTAVTMMRTRSIRGGVTYERVDRITL
jgi:2'-5' RNA ligase